MLFQEYKAGAQQTNLLNEENLAPDFGFSISAKGTAVLYKYSTYKMCNSVPGFNALSLPEMHYILIFTSSLGHTSTKGKGRREGRPKETAHGSAGQQVKLDPQTLCYSTAPASKNSALRYLSLRHIPSLPKMTIKVSKRSQSLQPC